MSETPENGVLCWLVRSTETGIEVGGFVRSDRAGALILGGPTGTHFTSHGEGWRSKWEELLHDGFIVAETARARDAKFATWQPPRLSRKEGKLLAIHRRDCDAV